jgi:Domain of unknown function (DUF2383)
MSDEYIEEFNSYLAGELTAVEYCDSALSKASREDIKKALQACRASHQKRVDGLKDSIKNLGGTPTDTSGPFGAISNANHATITLERDALALVEQSEAERLVNYESQRELVVGAVLQFLENVLLPAQHESHLAVSTTLKAIDPIPAK